MKKLYPVKTVSSKNEYLTYITSNEYLLQKSFLEKTSKNHVSDILTFDGFCIPCNKKVSFLVDLKWGGNKIDNKWLPNWRERLECPLCKMNNRQRLIASLIQQELSNQNQQKIYFMEQVTPIYNWAKKTLITHEIIGSEYLGNEYESGSIINDIWHEDIESLSFKTEYFSLIVSNDVFEHVPNPKRGFAECYRVLKPDGVLLATIPFNVDNDQSKTRAKIINGCLELEMEPHYHGNPLSEKGSLVFTDFGWDMFDWVRAIGFREVTMEIYFSEIYGHLGQGLWAFKCIK